MKIPQNKVKTFVDRQLSKVFHIAPLVNLFEILHQLKVIIENPHLKVDKFKMEKKTRLIDGITRLSVFPFCQTPRCLARSAGLNKPAAM